ncbi:hypothetical protein O6H91_05G013700 [Diphasiastrum complanatum]|uniref:Uncharacterized protein n=2 Tax=Diphasiastrum complanatum TaxID=34168 RepID=A0ACC2DLB3_DIPCM|nr:hypothetical protein O6H91_05G013500 [Diphasiastrum complanatum]KAJ7554872.1 hypothetical protein O6H91_05G013700 [Diphasiastrum complanatum]
MKALEGELDCEYPEKPESIHKLARRIKKSENSLYNALLSIFDDSLFVEEMRSLWPQLPLLANLRCGLWYSSQFDGVCYFKSTDGHTGNWSFSSTRLNLHVASLAAERGGCMIVDATRKGKRFPDSMSKTIPIWACVINRTIADLRVTLPCDKFHTADSVERRDELGYCEFWDSALHLPVWVSKTEKTNIECRIDDWVQTLKTSGADLTFLIQTLRKPLQPLWISQQSLIWLNEVPDAISWPFTPIILVSASHPTSSRIRVATGGSSWAYIPGAADDEESWARGLTPALFWKHAYDIMGVGPEECKRKVWEVAEKDRVSKAVRGLDAPQIRLSSKSGNPSLEGSRKENVHMHVASVHTSESAVPSVELELLQKQVFKADSRLRQSVPTTSEGIHWISTTGLAIGSAKSELATNWREVVDCIINCCKSPSYAGHPSVNYDLNMNIMGAKFDRHSLESHLSAATLFAREKLTQGETILILCNDGEDISVCVCLGILLSCFKPTGKMGFERAEFPSHSIAKSDLRKALVFISSFHSEARPCRGNLKQVYNYLSAQRLDKP